MNEVEDYELYLNPILLISKLEKDREKNKLKLNLDVNALKEQNSGEFQYNNRNNDCQARVNASMNSNANTNAANENSFNDNNINFNISFFSFGDKNKKEERKELTQKSIEILKDFVSKEGKMKEIGIINEKDNDNKKIKFCEQKIEIKISLKKLENNLSNYFKRPFMRKNYANDNLFKNVIVDDKKEDKKIGISEENEKKNVIEKININNLKEI